MDQPAARDNFYTSIPPFTEFEEVADDARYRSLPDDWQVGVADIVDSTGAIANNRYKEVNTVGASVIAAVRNAMDGTPFPFVFGGDGAEFAVPPSAVARVGETLAKLRRWAEEETGLALRAALVPISDIRAAGLDVAVARFRPSPDVDYAMFTGGGVAWADRRMKDGAYMIDPAPPGARPDLTSLSCRWRPLKSRNGEIVSLLVVPSDGADAARFAALVRRVIAIIDEGADDAGRPLPKDGPKFSIVPRGQKIECCAQAAAGIARLRRLGVILGEVLLAWALDRMGARLGRFDPRRYRQELARNTDFRKFDDGLKLTIDCPPSVTAALEAELVLARRDGIARYGLHRQDSALMTCIVPSPTTADHMHFVDGADGGYARAAEMLKADG
ncbi:MAG: DUF3095 domain-containing protein [Alphaproteobacteria bacterium]